VTRAALAAFRHRCFAELRCLAALTQLRALQQAGTKRLRTAKPLKMSHSFGGFFLKTIKNNFNSFSNPIYNEGSIIITIQSCFGAILAATA
jgi:hypothetical protein